MSRLAPPIVERVGRFDFPDRARLAKAALPVAERIAQLCACYHRRGWPALFANDNFVDWQTDSWSPWTLCVEPAQRGARIAEPLAAQHE